MKLTTAAAIRRGAVCAAGLAGIALAGGCALLVGDVDGTAHFDAGHPTEATARDATREAAHGMDARQDHASSDAGSSGDAGACEPASCSGTCNGDRCQVTLVRYPAEAGATTFGQIKLDSTFLYVVYSSRGSELVDKVPLAVDGPTTPTTFGACGGCNGAPGLAVDSTSVYVGFNSNAGEHLVRQTKSGGDQTNIAFTAQSSSPIAIAVDAQNLYWTVGGSNPGTPVFAEPLLGDGGSFAFARTSSAIAYSVVASGAHVFWTDSVGSIYSVLPDGGSLSPLVSQEGNPTSLVLAGSTLFWTDTQGQSIHSIPVAGAPSACTLANVADGQPVAIAVSGDDVYFAVSKPTGGSYVAHVPSACVASPAPPTIVGTGTNIVSVGATGTAVYWADEESDGSGILVKSTGR